MSRIKVLIADDSQVARTILKRSLLAESDQLDISEVADDQAAIEVYEETEPDMVFVDLNMPVKNGFEVIEEIKRVNAKAFVVMVTSDGTKETKETAIGLAANGFLVKPYAPQFISQIMGVYQAWISRPS